MQEKRERTAKGAGPGSKISRRQILRAAREYYFEDRSQAEIAAGLGISPSYLARKLAEAKAEGLIRIHIEADRDDAIAAQLKAAFPALRRVEVVHGGREERAVDEVAQAVAQIVDERLEVAAAPRIAIGGGHVHRLVVEKLEPRKVVARIGPTALTPFLPGTGRFTAPLVASLLAHRLGVLDGPAGPDGANGELCDLSTSPEYESGTHFRTWWERLAASAPFKTIDRFWRAADVVLIGARPASQTYPDVRERLDLVGRPLKQLESEGAVGTCANQFYNAAGELIALFDGVAGYEPAISLETLRTLAKESDRLIILDTYGREAAKSARPLLLSGVCNTLVCDAATATALLAAK